MKSQILNNRKDYFAQNKLGLTKNPFATATVISLLLAVILSSCTGLTGNAPFVASDDNIELIASPTPTFALPGPDEEDPRMDCVLDAPGCIINTGIESIDGAVYIGASIAIDRGQLKDYKGSHEEIVLDAKVSIIHEGKHVGNVEVQDRTIAVASPDADLVLTNPGGEPTVNVIATVNGFLFRGTNPVPGCPDNPQRCPQPPQDHPYFSFDLATGDIFVHSNEGIPVGEVEYTFPPGVVFGDGSDDAWPNWIWIFGHDTDDEWPNWGDDSWPNWGWAFSFADNEDSALVISDPEGNPVVTLGSSDNELFVFEPNGFPVATIHPDAYNSNQLVLNFKNIDGNPGASLSPQEGGISIDMGLGGEPVAIIAPIKDGVMKVEEGEPITLKILIPLPRELSGKVILTGAVEIFTKDASGASTVISKVPVEIGVEDITKYMKVEEGEPGKIPTETPAKAPPKSTPLPSRVPPKSTPVPTESKDKIAPTPTPGK